MLAFAWYVFVSMFVVSVCVHLCMHFIHDKIRLSLGLKSLILFYSYDFHDRIFICSHLILSYLILSCLILSFYC